MLSSIVFFIRSRSSIFVRDYSLVNIFLFIINRTAKIKPALASVKDPA
jgi:hypothetical protein